VYFDCLYSFLLKQFWFWEELSEIISQMNIQLHVKYSLFISYCNQDWLFSTDFRRNTKISNFMKTCPVGVGFFHAERRTDRHEAFCSFFRKHRTKCVVSWTPREAHEQIHLWLFMKFILLGFNIAKNRYFPASFSKIIPYGN